MSSSGGELDTGDKTVQSRNETTADSTIEDTIDPKPVSSNQADSNLRRENSIQNKLQREDIDPAEKSSSTVNKNEISVQNVDPSDGNRVKASSTDNQKKEQDDSDEDDKFKVPSIPDQATEINSEHAEHVTYNVDGTAIYTDPNTKHKYHWCEKANNWLALESSSAQNPDENPFENEHYKWCTETQQWILKETQATETEFYKWDAKENKWVQKQQQKQEQCMPATSATENKQGTKEEKVYSIDENGQRIYTDKDGVVFFWDEEKNAWFPKIDDDFMARYQMNYGFIDNVSAGEEEKRKKEAADAQRKADELERMAEEARAASLNADGTNTSNVVGGKRKNQEPPKWFDIDPEHNTKVYVSNLPLDITLDEFAELMGKCGMIMRDPQTQKFKLKLYTEPDGQIKGDGLCDYIKVESVNLALKILDEYVYRGNKILVQRAKFQMRGEYNPSLKPKRKKKDKEKLNKLKERLFDWRPDKMRGERSKNEKVVIIKNLFTPELFEKNIQLILEYQNDLREECSKCGTVRKVIIYDLHPEGVAQVNMASPEEADLVIQMMQGRFFGKRQLSAEHWDGKTKYKIGESEKEAQERLSNWDEFLEADGEKMAKDEETEEKTMEAQIIDKMGEDTVASSGQT